MRNLERKLAYILIILFLVNLAAVLFMVKQPSIVVKAVSSNLGDVKFCINHPPSLQAIPDQTATEAGFAYQVNASDVENQTLSFYDNTSLFEINHSTGFINWSNPPVGNFSFNIFVDDNSGCANSQNSTVLNVRITKGYCGDGVCGDSESCSGCPADCGNCPAPGPGPRGIAGAGGVAGGAPGCAPNWSCSEWSDCMPDNKMYRQCRDLKDCGVSEGKPLEVVDCEYRLFLGNFSDTPVIVEDLQVGELWWFILDGKVDEVLLDSIKGDAAFFATTSGLNFNLEDGESILLDVNRDGTGDLEVKLNEILSENGVRATFKLVKEKKPTKVMPLPIISECMWYWVLIVAIIIFWLAEGIPILRYRKKLEVGYTSISISRRKVRRGYWFLLMISIILTLLVLSELLGIRKCHSVLKPLFIDFPLLWIVVLVLVLLVLIVEGAMPWIIRIFRRVVREFILFLHRIRVRIYRKGHVRKKINKIKIK